MMIAVSLLRGINVGGRNKIRMADLRAMYSDLGLCHVRSILQSGNVVFATPENDLARVRREIEAGIRRAFGLEIPVLLRSSTAFDGIFSRHGFSAEQLREPRKAAVVFLSGEADAGAVDELRAGNPGSEIIQADGRELYIYYTDGVARSKLDNKRIDRQLGLISTARNWNTCVKLRQLLDAD